MIPSQHSNPLNTCPYQKFNDVIKYGMMAPRSNDQVTHNPWLVVSKRNEVKVLKNNAKVAARAAFPNFVRT
jgi:hypothetical protein